MSGSTKTALILGATGGVGGETAQALQQRGWRIRALVRNRQVASEKAQMRGYELMEGDALKSQDVLRAADGAAIIVHAVNPPGYRQWESTVLPMLDNTIAAAKTGDARILLPGTIYNYGPDAFPMLTESSPQNPATSKGALRVAMEQRLDKAANEGVRSVVLRAGDFFGPVPGNNWFSQGLITPGRPIATITYPGKAGIGHSWAYLPDVGEAFARFAEMDDQLPTAAKFHFAGYWDADGTAVTSAIRRIAGRRDIKIKSLPWFLLRFIAPFNETIRSLIEMRGFWQAPVRLDNSRLLATLHVEPHTPLDTAIEVTLRALGCLENR